MITDCAAGCGKKVIARPDGKAYLCRPCWRNLFSTLFRVIRSAKEPTLTTATVYIFTGCPDEKAKGHAPPKEDFAART